VFFGLREHFQTFDQKTTSSNNLYYSFILEVVIIEWLIAIIYERCNHFDSLSFHFFKITTHRLCVFAFCFDCIEAIDIPYQMQS
jgi:hypothetical protein